eukprot:TRINITY_DN10119_c0_g1_i3.p2 TRINITY_DN10119_c0_g1~~TRINITY_DN10119_c0_g1_i3.p2  ORF type:complete len:169 (+),score=23.19 TRINITY_DN10119_c0_g1_i3:1361-1867(+)
MLAVSVVCSEPERELLDLHYVHRFPSLCCLVASRVLPALDPTLAPVRRLSLAVQPSLPPIQDQSELTLSGSALHANLPAPMPDSDTDDDDHVDLNEVEYAAAKPILTSPPASSPQSSERNLSNNDASDVSATSTSNDKAISQHDPVAKVQQTTTKARRLKKSKLCSIQ